MRPFIFATRNGLELFDLNATVEAMEKAKEAVRNKIKAGATILFVATQAEAREAVEELAKKSVSPRYQPLAGRYPDEFQDSFQAH